MAKSAKGKAAGKVLAQKTESPTALAARIVLDVGSDIPSYYINYADVAQSSHEFTLTVGKTPTRLSQQSIRDVQATGELHVEAMLQLILPPTLLPSLIKALTSQKDLYEHTFGTIRDGSEPPRGTLQ